MCFKNAPEGAFFPIMEAHKYERKLIKILKKVGRI